MYINSVNEVWLLHLVTLNHHWKSRSKRKALLMGAEALAEGSKAEALAEALAAGKDAEKVADALSAALDISGEEEDAATELAAAGAEAETTPELVSLLSEVADTSAGAAAKAEDVQGPSLIQTPAEPPGVLASVQYAAVHKSPS